jgi:NAD(P)-dependent dehydrogenase (short-subunit alcohol dehydrogenase family)
VATVRERRSGASEGKVPPAMKLEEGQVAVVTGAASGIGFALAGALSRRGLPVVLADVEQPALNTAVTALQVRGSAVRGIRCDVTDPAQVEALGDLVIQEFGRVDVVCNNAGVMVPFGPMWQRSRADWRWVIDVNLWGVVHGVMTFVPVLVAQGNGHVVNTASMAGVTTIPFNGLYNTTKHAVVALTETLAAELQERSPGVGATVVCPGLVSTRIGEAARNRPDGREEGGASALPDRVPAQQRAVILDADVVAAQTLTAIEQNRLYVFTHPGAADRIRQRADRLLADTKPLPHAAGES